MAEFPKLRTGVVAQYPAARNIAFFTHVVEFVDGTDQRYRGWAGPLRRWEIRLDLLDESEMAGIEEFFIANGGRAASIAFTDPSDNTTYPDCSFESDSLTLEYEDELRGKAKLVITGNRR
jgi:hypothetical protein